MPHSAGQGFTHPSYDQREMEMPHPSRQGLVYPVYGHREIEMIRAPGSIRLLITAEEYKETFRGMMEY